MLKELTEIQGYIAKQPRNSAMGEHLITLFNEALEAKPTLIVELGVGPGQSTFALERAARAAKAVFISIDREDFSEASDYHWWFFVQADDLLFAPHFEAFCQENGLKPQIDVLFIDTEHSYEQASEEIAAWFPFLSGRSKAILHNTNLQKVCYRRDGRKLPKAHDIQRGVIRALQDYFGRAFDEESAFAVNTGDWMITHHPYTFGLTVCEKREGAGDVLKQLAEIRRYMQTRPPGFAMGDHLTTLFEESLEVGPDVIVELGVWPGESTVALERAARVTGAALISVDVRDGSPKSRYEQAFFVQDDDLAFAERFKAFCKAGRLKPRVDVLFIDSLHSYGHVSQLMAGWFPLLSDHAKVMFHDTNLQAGGFAKDGSALTRGKNIGRGVIRAIEEYFGRTYDEEAEFVDHVGNWTITHHPYAYGFTICEHRESGT